VTCECAREQDVLDAAATGRWPDRVDADLRAHVAECAVCADVAEIAPVFVADRDAAWEQADVPSAGRVWWRARMRVRREAAAQAAQPMVLVERAALAYAGVALFGLGMLLGAWIQGWAHAAVRFVRWLVPSQEALGGLATAMGAGVLPVVAVTVALLLAPVLLYVALADR
jgi:hypothetical protein